MAINLKLKQAQSEDKEKHDIYGLSLRDLANPHAVVAILKDNPIIVKDAIKKSGGWITSAANMLSCTTLQLTFVISQTPELLETFLEVREKYLDFAEAKLLGLVKQGELEAIKFWLKCQGKDRGWTERPPNEQEIPHGAFTINIEPAFTFNNGNNDSNEVIKNAESKTLIDIKQEYKKPESAIAIKTDLKRNKLEMVFAQKDFNNEELWQK